MSTYGGHTDSRKLVNTVIDPERLERRLQIMECP